MTKPEQMSYIAVLQPWCAKCRWGPTGQGKLLCDIHSALIRVLEGLDEDLMEAPTMAGYGSATDLAPQDAYRPLLGASWAELARRYLQEHAALTIGQDAVDAVNRLKVAVQTCPALPLPALPCLPCLACPVLPALSCLHALPSWLVMYAAATATSCWTLLSASANLIHTSTCLRILHLQKDGSACVAKRAQLIH